MGTIAQSLQACAWQILNQQRNRLLEEPFGPQKRQTLRLPLMHLNPPRHLQSADSRCGCGRIGRHAKAHRRA